MPPLTDDFARRADDRRHPGHRSSVAPAAAGPAHVARTVRASGLDTAVLDAALGLTRRAIDAGHGPDEVSAPVELLAG